MTGPLGNSEFCFPGISMFPSTSSRETLRRFSGNKIHSSPRDQSLSVKCCSIMQMKNNSMKGSAQGCMLEFRGGGTSFYINS